MVVLRGQSGQRAVLATLRIENNVLEADDGGLGGLLLGELDRLGDVLESVVSVVDAASSRRSARFAPSPLHPAQKDAHEHLPVVRLEPLGNVLGEGDVGGAIDGDVVVVVDHDQLAELEVTARFDDSTLGSCDQVYSRHTQRGKRPRRRHPP